ncbi:DUF6207 family protein [Streptomyces sp. CB02261]|uniref:DUF6207 family protein n=1 Tax=Streptomyces sp. CB02261 TaxID=1703940 RepID=UPI000AA9FA37
MQIHEQHLAEPGAGVLDVTVVDLETACVALDGPRQLWTASGRHAGRRMAGESGRANRVHAAVLRCPGRREALAFLGTEQHQQPEHRNHDQGPTERQRGEAEGYVKELPPWLSPAPSRLSVSRHRRPVPTLSPWSHPQAQPHLLALP